MALFLVLSILLLALALALLLPTLWRASRGTAVAVLLVLPLAVAVLYAWKGRPEAIGLVAASPAATGPGMPAAMEEAIAGLERKLARQPGDAAGWALLGRSRMVQGQFLQAREAYAQASALRPDDIELKVDYAEAQMRAWPGEGFPPSAAVLLEQAVAADPGNVRALYILGLHRAGSGDPAKALSHWQALLPLLDEAEATQLRQQMGELARSQGLPLDPGQAAASDSGAATASGGAPHAKGDSLLHVEISLDPRFATRIADGDTLFVVARTGDGAGPPAAVKRLPAAGFPLQVELGDGDSMMPSLLLSRQASVKLSARISRSGVATPASGDIEAEAVAVRPGDTGVVRLRLSHVRP